MDPLSHKSSDLLFKARSGYKVLNFDELLELDYDEIESLFEYLLMLKLKKSRLRLLEEEAGKNK